MTSLPPLTETRPAAAAPSIPASASPTSSRSLFAPPTPDLTTPRNALFDDHIPHSHIPGSLHLAPDATISHLVARTGAIPLIRQLAEDLAHRDRELVLFRRRAEERERALRKMLVEAEISNADIEKRLTAATLRDNADYTENMEDMMGQAMEDEDAFSVVEEDARSVAESQVSAKSARLGGWGSLFWGKREVEGEETVRAGRRGGRAPVIGRERSRVSTKSATKRSSSAAFPQSDTAGWAAKVAQEEEGEARQRSSSDAGLEVPKRRPSTATGGPESLAKSVAARSVGQQAQKGKTRSRAPSTSSPATKTTFFQDIKDTAGRIVPLGGSGEAASAPAANPDAGPVEMDMIIPHAVQPPTLLHSWNQYYPTDHLTDRFGFIYDKRRETVAVKGVASIRGSYTERKPPEDLKLDLDATKPPTARRTLDRPESSSRWDNPLDKGPLLTAPLSTSPVSISPTSTTPTGKPETLITRLSRPNPPTTSPALVTNAFSSAPLGIAASTSTAEETTVRLLLTQLSDLHDSLQRDRTTKWNEFLRKIRVERGTSTEEADTLIGIATLGTEGRGGKQRWKEFRDLVLGGIPVAYRWKIWTECSGATAMKVPGYYDDLLAQTTDDPVVLAQIGMDINRTLTDNIFFRQGPGVQKLRQVLVAYSRRNRDVGYCQGMNMIAASLLLIMPSEEDAFWVLCSIVERILPKTYFEPNLLASRADQQVLKHYVATILPTLHTHLASLNVELEALTFQWFLSIFTDTLTAEALFRVWDAVLCVAGSTFLFQVAVALLRLNEQFLLECGSAAEVYSYLNGGMIHQGISIDGLMTESDALKGVIRRKEVEGRREGAVRRELRERRGERREEEEAEERKGRAESTRDDSAEGESVRKGDDEHAAQTESESTKSLKADNSGKPVEAEGRKGRTEGTRDDSVEGESARKGDDEHAARAESESAKTLKADNSAKLVEAGE